MLTNMSTIRSKSDASVLQTKKKERKKERKKEKIAIFTEN